MPFRPEPTIPHGQPARTAIVYCNLGTPDEPSAPALRRYLAEFLWDPRVVEIPRPLWWLILNGVILRTRPAKSAAKYKSIWMPEGSPLAVWTERQAKMDGTTYDVARQKLADGKYRLSANKIFETVGGDRNAVLLAVKVVRDKPQYRPLTEDKRPALA